MQCPNCQMKVETQDKVCPHCGQDLTFLHEAVTEKNTKLNITETTDKSSLSNEKNSSSEAEVEPTNQVSLQSEQTTTTHEQPKDVFTTDQQLEKEADTRSSRSESHSHSTQEAPSTELDDLDLLKPHLHHAKNYFQQLKEGILHPSIGKASHQLLGIINFVVIGLLFSLTFSRILGVLLRSVFSTMNQFSGMMGEYSDSMMPNVPTIHSFPMFFLFFVAVFLTQTLLVIVYWIFLMIMQVPNASFKHALNQIFEPLSLLVIVGIVSFVLALMGSIFTGIAMLLSILYFLLLRYSFDGSIWLVENPKGYNRFYITMVPFILYSVMSFIVLQIVLRLLIENTNIIGFVQNMIHLY
ncbi:zinc ribbon domain-containing protein [uncultured Enterococcus sp.]|uniref:zinc ribbon domain-containing protein n=1 Tax=uncultured Enterococcus sp. TaxID=167972 RepID=UPI0026270172|nr:zinc ribbon domain-containing protein [uncultured Enterococcus sp.]